MRVFNIMFESRRLYTLVQCGGDGKRGRGDSEEGRISNIEHGMFNDEGLGREEMAGMRPDSRERRGG